MFLNIHEKVTAGAHLQQSGGQTSVPCYRSDSQSVDRARQAGPAAQRGPGEKNKRERSALNIEFPFNQSKTHIETVELGYMRDKAGGVELLTVILNIAGGSVLLLLFKMCLDIIMHNLECVWSRMGGVLLHRANTVSSPPPAAWWCAWSPQGEACLPFAQPGDGSHTASPWRSILQTTPPRRKTAAGGTLGVSGRKSN